MEKLIRPVVHALRGRSILFHGMKRSGNHAVLDWIQTGDRFEFRNNVLNFQVLHDRGELDKQRHVLSYPALGKLTLRNWVRIRRQLASIEDMTVSRWLFHDPEPAGLINVVLVRSATNMFASRVKRAFTMEHAAWSRSMDAVMLRTRRLWMEHAREALGETAFLSNKVVVFYDRFIVDAEYRARIAESLRIHPDDASLGRQAQYGHGSSFHSGQSPQLLPVSPEALRNRDKLLDGPERALLDAVLDDAELRRLDARLNEL